MRLEWRPLALADRERIFDFIAKDDPVAALNLDEMFEKRADLLIEYPESHRSGREKGTREMVVHPDYIVIYRIQKAFVEILRVKHTGRQQP